MAKEQELLKRIEALEQQIKELKQPINHFHYYYTYQLPQYGYYYWPYQTTYSSGTLMGGGQSAPVVS